MLTACPWEECETRLPCGRISTTARSRCVKLTSDMQSEHRPSGHTQTAYGCQARRGVCACGESAEGSVSMASRA